MVTLTSLTRLPPRVITKLFDALRGYKECRECEKRRKNNAKKEECQIFHGRGDLPLPRTKYIQYPSSGVWQCCWFSTVLYRSLERQAEARCVAASSQKLHPMLEREIHMLILLPDLVSVSLRAWEPCAWAVMKLKGSEVVRAFEVTSAHST